MNLRKTSCIVMIQFLLCLTAGNLTFGGHGATNVMPQNLAQLTETANIILVGKVIGLKDDLAKHNLPYTEITFEVSRWIKRDRSALTSRPTWERLQRNQQTSYPTFTYRQFGLLKPRDMGNGKALAVTLDGFPRYTLNEEVMIFLYKPSSRTGFRTTVGLGQGKFSITNGRITNIVNNRKLFANMDLERTLFTTGERYMSTQRSGPLDADMLINLVDRAVQLRLFQRRQVAP